MAKRVAIVGGTRFVGLAAVRELVEAGHDVLVAHRGEHLLPADPDLVNVVRCQGPREEILAEGGPVERFRPEVMIDTFGGGATKAKAELLVETASRSATERLVAISSCDVYQAFVDAGLGDGSGRLQLPPTTLPITEDSPRRVGPYPGGSPDHDNVAMEDAVAAFPGSVVVLRPGAIYGPHDMVCREWPLIRRAQDRVRHLPLPAAGVQVFHRVAVERVARAIRAAVDTAVSASPGLWACNVVDPYDWTYAGLAAEVGRLLDWEWEPEVVSYEDAVHPWRVGSPLLVSDARLRDVLAIAPDKPDPRAALAATVDWYLDHGPHPDSPYIDW